MDSQRERLTKRLRIAIWTGPVFVLMPVISMFLHGLAREILFWSGVGLLGLVFALLLLTV